MMAAINTLKFIELDKSTYPRPLDEYLTVENVCDYSDFKSFKELVVIKPKLHIFII